MTDISLLRPDRTGRPAPRSQTETHSEHRRHGPPGTGRIYMWVPRVRTCTCTCTCRALQGYDARTRGRTPGRTPPSRWARASDAPGGD
eukprot:2553016-Prymnesium_polylepis.1